MEQTMAKVILLFTLCSGYGYLHFGSAVADLGNDCPLHWTCECFLVQELVKFAGARQLNSCGKPH